MTKARPCGEPPDLFESNGSFGHEPAAIIRDFVENGSVGLHLDGARWLLFKPQGELQFPGPESDRIEVAMFPSLLLGSEIRRASAPIRRDQCEYALIRFELSLRFHWM